MVYSGCQCPFYLAHFQSDDTNKASEVDSNHCPLGKFGYDTRCRDWYTTGRKFYLESNRPTHVTQPFITAEGDYATVATAAIGNPATGDYVGQTLLNFSPKELLVLLSEANDQLGFIVTPFDGIDSVVLTLGENEWKPITVNNYIFGPDRNQTSSSSQYFLDTILSRMIAGGRGHETFSRPTATGKEDTMNIDFAPVNAKMLLPLDPSDFSRGVRQTEELVYSIGIVYQSNEFHTPWEITKEDIDDDMTRLQTIYLCTIIVISACCLCISFIVSIRPLCMFDIVDILTKQ